MEWAYRAGGATARWQKWAGLQRFDGGNDLQWKAATGDET
jgi:hypothetical protein